jgi:hypothetical protein
LSARSVSNESEGNGVDTVVTTMQIWHMVFVILDRLRSLVRRSRAPLFIRGTPKRKDIEARKRVTSASKDHVDENVGACTWRGERNYLDTHWRPRQRLPEVEE